MKQFPEMNILQAVAKDTLEETFPWFCLILFIKVIRLKIITSPFFIKIPRKKKISLLSQPLTCVCPYISTLACVNT